MAAKKRRPATPALLSELRSELRKAADEARAKPMQAYMKSEMPYLGVTVPKMRAV